MQYTTQLSIAILASFAEWKLTGKTNPTWIILGSIAVDTFSPQSLPMQVCPILAKINQLLKKVLYFIDFHKLTHSLAMVGGLYMVATEFYKSDFMFHFMIGYIVHVAVESFSESGIYPLYPVIPNLQLKILNIKGKGEYIFNTLAWVAIIAIIIPPQYYDMAKEEGIKLVQEFRRWIV